MKEPLYLECNHCGCEFVPTDSQLNHLKYGETKKAFCSKICRQTSQAETLKKPPGEYICKSCGCSFTSKRPAYFCNMKCYVASAQFKDMLRKNAPKALAASVLITTGKELVPHVEVTCINCEQIWKEKPSRKSKFCNQKCYREYMAKRFDRWIASPQKIALPQAYDEFLTQEELPCLIEGCDWVGRHLSNHMNMTHGIPADEFKRAAGFNLHTGVVAPSVSQALRARPNVGIALTPGPHFKFDENNPRVIKNYRSLEGREHAIKAFALRRETIPEIEKVCRECGKGYNVSSITHYSKYCCRPCRDKAYQRERETRERVFAKCAKCGRTFFASYTQELRIKKGLFVACSPSCRQSLNGSWKRKSKEAYTI